MKVVETEEDVQETNISKVATIANAVIATYARRLFTYFIKHQCATMAIK